MFFVEPLQWNYHELPENHKVWLRRGNSPRLPKFRAQPSKLGPLMSGRPRAEEDEDLTVWPGITSFELWVPIFAAKRLWTLDLANTITPSKHLYWLAVLRSETSLSLWVLDSSTTGVLPIPKKERHLESVLTKIWPWGFLLLSFANRAECPGCRGAAEGKEPPVGLVVTGST